MADLYFAHELVNGEVLRRVAIKVLPHGPERSARGWRETFEREGRIHAGLVHPNICHVYEFRCEGALSFIAMEWVHGVALHELMRAQQELRSPLPVQLAANIGAQIAAGLEHAHSATSARDEALFLVHRDVSPSNVMVRYDGVVKLVDFGIARVAATRESGSERIVGKLSYMAPEQILGGSVDARADIFALGVCLYELMTGTRLYPHLTTARARRATLDRPVPPLRALRPDVPRALDAIVMRALARAPQDRYQRAGDVQAALEDYLASEGVVTGARPLSTFMKGLYGERPSTPPLTWNASLRSALEAAASASRQPLRARIATALATTAAALRRLSSQIRALTGPRFAFGAAAATAVWGLSLLRDPSAEALETACLPPVLSAPVITSASVPLIEQMPASVAVPSARERTSTRARGAFSSQASPPPLSFVGSLPLSARAATSGAQPQEHKAESRRPVPFVSSPGF
jgi:serine/threonine-protein kinase